MGSPQFAVTEIKPPGKYEIHDMRPVRRSVFFMRCYRQTRIQESTILANLYNIERLPCHASPLHASEVAQISYLLSNWRWPEHLPRGSLLDAPIFDIDKSDVRLWKFPALSQPWPSGVAARFGVFLTTQVEPGLDASLIDPRASNVAKAGRGLEILCFIARA
jgi:hypothetical protein